MGIIAPFFLVRIVVTVRYGTVQYRIVYRRYGTVRDRSGRLVPYGTVRYGTVVG